jgi:phosphatidylglycerophosphatase A
VSRGLERLRTACITVCGAGFGPKVPGTWGALVALIVFLILWFMLPALGAGRMVLEAVTVAGIAVTSWIAVLWGEWAIARFGSQDPKPFVLDEFAGQWVALLALPVALSGSFWAVAVMAGGQFVLFRIFDILKLSPAREAERLPAGWGILTDDLVAGLQANVLGQLVWRFTPLAAWLHLSWQHVGRTGG